MMSKPGLALASSNGRQTKTQNSFTHGENKSFTHISTYLNIFIQANNVRYISFFRYSPPLYSHPQRLFRIMSGCISDWAMVLATVFSVSSGSRSSSKTGGRRRTPTMDALLSFIIFLTMLNLSW